MLDGQSTCQRYNLFSGRKRKAYKSGHERGHIRLMRLMVEGNLPEAKKKMNSRRHELWKREIKRWVA